MIRVVKILPRATIQLYESAAWWATNRSPNQAARWLVKIEETIQSLADSAQRYPLAQESDAFEFRLHQMNFGVSKCPTHRILFSFDDTQVVEYAIRHLSQEDITQDDLE